MTCSRETLSQSTTTFIHADGTCSSVPLNNLRFTPYLFQLEQEDENDDAAEVTWGKFLRCQQKMELIKRTEDQQQINTFSKLNTRFRNIEEKLEELKARIFISILRYSLTDLDAAREGGAGGPFLRVRTFR